MAEYIEREALLEILDNQGHADIDDVLSIPAADVVEVRHGRWVPHNEGMNNWVECSECNTVGSPFWKGCPVCLARMDGE